MLVFSVTLLALFAIVLGKDQDHCKCVEHSDCKGTVIENEKCEVPHFVCCASKGLSKTDEPIRSQTGIVCGKSGNENIADLKVYGDDVNTSFGEFPWMVALMRINASGPARLFCGGSILSPNIVLTGAVCVGAYSGKDILVKAGVWDIVDPEEVSKHQDRSVSRIIIHPEYNSEFKNYANDLAILVLSEPLTMSDNVGVVCLPSSEVQLNTSGCLATGWGTGNHGRNTTGTSSLLKKVHVPLVDFNSCQDQLRQNLGPNFNLHSSFMCAGGGKADTCQGDGGGPLMCPTLDDPKHYTQVGVTSWGVKCGQGPPGVYASVQAAATWIEDTIRSL